MEITLGQKLKQLRAARGWTQNDLAKRSGVERGYLAHLELDKVAKPSADIFLKLAHAFRIHPEELYQAAGYIKEAKTAYKQRESIPDQLDRIRLSLVAIPVYREFSPHISGFTEPVNYVYRAPSTPARRSLEGYVVKGNCLAPKIEDGNIIIVDRDAPIDSGDYVAGLVKGEMVVARLRKIANELWLENNRGRFKLEECETAAPIIEVIRRLK